MPFASPGGVPVPFASAGGVPVPFALLSLADAHLMNPITFFSTPPKKPSNRLVPEIQLMSTKAIAVAAKMTSTYSTVP